jgi:hypothetical protein
VGRLRRNIILGKVSPFGLGKAFRDQELLYGIMGKLYKGGIEVVIFVIVVVVREFDGGDQNGTC